MNVRNQESEWESFLVWAPQEYSILCIIYIYLSFVFILYGPYTSIFCVFVYIRLRERKRESTLYFCQLLDINNIV